MRTISELRQLGYVVGDVDATTINVSGYGIDVYVSSSDSTGIDALSNPAFHAERVYQFFHHHRSSAAANSPEVLACRICNP